MLHIAQTLKPFVLSAEGLTRHEHNQNVLKLMRQLFYTTAYVVNSVS